jgi:hypothetical protein
MTTAIGIITVAASVTARLMSGSYTTVDKVRLHPAHHPGRLALMSAHDAFRNGNRDAACDSIRPKRAALRAHIASADLECPGHNSYSPANTASGGDADADDRATIIVALADAVQAQATRELGASSHA